MKEKNKLLVFGIVIIVALTGFALWFSQKETKKQTPTTEQPKKIVASAVIYPEADVYSMDDQVVIMIDSRKNAITGVQLELKYDPSVLSNVQLTSVSGEGAFFAEESDHLVLFNKQDEKLGRISYAVGIAPSSLSRAGIGKIAELSFTKTGTERTTITFLPKTRATQAHFSGSVLAEARDIVIE